jgi:hypothetical protein
MKFAAPSRFGHADETDPDRLAVVDVRERQAD